MGGLGFALFWGIALVWGALGVLNLSRHFGATPAGGVLAAASFVLLAILGVVIGGITPVGRTFMVGSSLFPSATRGCVPALAEPAY